jgi:GTP-binding protein
MPQYFITSSEEGTGKEDVLTYIENVNNDIYSGSDF